MSDNEREAAFAPDAVTAETPRCKGCGSQRLVGVGQVHITDTYYDVLGLNADGDLLFKFSEGRIQNERCHIECGECGRRMRNRIQPLAVSR